MPRVIIKSIFLAFLVTLLFASVGLTQSSVTISTYYPSPYGVYDELRARKMAIGDNYYDRSATNIPNNTDLIVEDRVGIGTPNPQRELHVIGSIRASGNIRADTSMTLGGVTRSSWPTITYSGQYNREIHNVKNGVSRISMGNSANRACFLTREITEDLDSRGEWAGCYAFISGGRWYLDARTGPDCDDCDVWCSARCLLW